MNRRAGSLMLSLHLLAGAAHAQSTVEQLGFPEGTRLLIVHGDDFGETDPSNRAARALATQGVLSSASLMAPCPAFAELVEWAREQARPLDYGLHLTLNSARDRPWGPVAPVETVRSLVNEQGHLHHTRDGFSSNARSDEIRIELRAQIARSRALGLEPTHLDVHMAALFRRPDTFYVYLEVAREVGIVPMIPRLSEDLVDREIPDELLAVVPVLRLAFEGIEKRGYVLLDSLISTTGDSYPERKRHLIGWLESLEPGLHQVILHPSIVDPELVQASPSWAHKQDDFDLLIDPEVGDALERMKIVRVGWREVNRLFRQRIGLEDR